MSIWRAASLTATLILALGFSFQSARAEVFSVNSNLSKDAPHPLYRDNLIEKDLEIVYLGITEHPDPTDINDSVKEYRFRLRMLTWLGAVLAEKSIGVLEGPMRVSDIDLAVYDDKTGKWQEFRGVEIIVRPATTGTVSDITATGAGRFIDPELEPFASGAQQLDSALNIKIKGAYLPPNKTVTLTSFIFKKGSAFGEVTKLGNFILNGATDATGKITALGPVNISEPFDDRNNDTYTITASASYYFTYKDTAIIELRSTHTDLIKNITVSDFELRNVASEFYTNRAYFTWNDQIKSLTESRLTRAEKKKGVVTASYGGGIKKYENISELTASLSDLKEKTMTFNINTGADSDTFTISRDSYLELKIENGSSTVEVNGVSKLAGTPLAGGQLFVSGGVPKIALRDKSGKILLEESGRDLRLIFENIAQITHGVTVTSGGAISLTFTPQPVNSMLKWSAYLESPRRPGLQKQFTLSGSAVYSPEDGAPAFAEAVSPEPDSKRVFLESRIAELQKKLVMLLQQLLALLTPQLPR